MQTQSEVLNIGADVAKDEIVVACSEGSFPVRKIANQRAAVTAFLMDLPAGSRIGLESTGIYHELLAEAAHKLGFIVFVLNPKDARHYAKGVGLRGKTDRVDAELIARMIAHEHTKLHVWIPPTPEQREMGRLLKRRAKLSSLRQAPIHKKLIELGFLKYVEKVKSAESKLIFPEWEPSRRRASANAEKWFRKFLRDTGLRDETPGAMILGMHAFRHTLLTHGAMQKPALSLSFITGHAQDEAPIPATGAGKGYLTLSMLSPLYEKADLLNQLDYGYIFRSQAALEAIDRRPICPDISRLVSERVRMSAP